jgi:hypothetical protein
MEDLNWLADLVCDCYHFGERHSDENVKFRAKEIVAAIERDFGLKFNLLPRRTASIEATPKGYARVSDNVIRFPLRPRKGVNAAVRVAVDL